MENFFAFLANSLVLRRAASPELKRFLIGQSGCSTLLHSQDRTLHIRYTKEGDKIYFNEFVAGKVGYGTVCVQMHEAYSLYNANNILVQYINRVRKPMNIIYNFSMEIEKSLGLITITDYWQDKAGIDWKIKGYTNGKVVALLYVKNINDSSVKNHDAFLNGFRFASAAKNK